MERTQLRHAFAAPHFVQLFPSLRPSTVWEEDKTWGQEKESRPLPSSTEPTCCVVFQSCLQVEPCSSSFLQFGTQWRESVHSRFLCRWVSVTLNRITQQFSSLVEKEEENTSTTVGLTRTSPRWVWHTTIHNFFILQSTPLLWGFDANVSAADEDSWMSANQGELREERVWYLLLVGLNRSKWN